MLAKLERVALWGIVIFMSLVGIYCWEHIDRVKAAVAVNAELLHAPKLQASVYPGVPTPLRESWKEAAPNAEGAPESGRWLTVRIANAGVGDAAKLTVRLEAAAPIAELRARTADGQTIGALNESIKVAEGGEGQSSVTIEFPELAPKQADLLFVALAPGGGAPDAWAADAPQHWRELVVSAAPDAYSDDVVTLRRFGLAPAAPAGG
jgi:hypothetical protein